MAQSVTHIPMSSPAAVAAPAEAEEGSPVGLRRRLHLLEQSITHMMRLGENIKIGTATIFLDMARSVIPIPMSSPAAAQAAAHAEAGQ